MRISDWSPDVGSSDLAYVKQIDGGIGYVELSYALQNKLTFTRLKNAAGNFVQPRDETFSAAAASADWANAKDFYLVMTNAPGENSWPITATNFILMYKQPKNAATANARKSTRLNSSHYCASRMPSSA